MGGALPVELGFFSGAVVASQHAHLETAAFYLPFPFIEGMSGTAVIAGAPGGGKRVLGVAHGNVQQRVVAQEIERVVTEDGVRSEAVHRLVELGEAYHAPVLVRFLEEVAPNSGYVVSDAAVDVPGLRDSG